MSMVERDNLPTDVLFVQGGKWLIVYTVPWMLIVLYLLAGRKWHILWRKWHDFYVQASVTNC